MKPQTVLKATTVEKATVNCEILSVEYDKIAAEYPEKEALCQALKARALRACALFENASEDFKELDGDFPLGNSYDGDFATPYFTLEKIALMQCGLQAKIKRAYYVEPAYDILVRNGFLAELEGDYKKAASCYSGVSLSSSVYERERACREKIKKDGE